MVTRITEDTTGQNPRTFNSASKGKKGKNRNHCNKTHYYVLSQFRRCNRVDLTIDTDCNSKTMELAPDQCAYGLWATVVYL